MTTDIVPKLRVWRCMNVKPDGHVCRNILAEVRAGPGTTLRIVCPKCHAVHVFTAAATDDIDEVHQRVIDFCTGETREVRR